MLFLGLQRIILTGFILVVFNKCGNFQKDVLRKLGASANGAGTWVTQKVWGVLDLVAAWTG